MASTLLSDLLRFPPGTRVSHNRGYISGAGTVVGIEDIKNGSYGRADLTVILVRWDNNTIISSMREWQLSLLTETENTNCNNKEG